MTQQNGLLPRDLAEVRIDRQQDSEADASRLEITRHVFDRDSIAAVNGALAAERPLLVRGEPGVGKTQLAAAVAARLDRPLVSYTVNARTESTDLLWKFDAVRRLADAQLCAATSGKLDEQRVNQRLRERRFVAPGPLWWGFDWTGAVKHLKSYRQEIDAGHDGKHSSESQIVLPDTGGNHGDGVVVLIDEIDKADTDVPNGLLEALGSRRFTPLDCDEVRASPAKMPLVVITTNEERVLPDAFIRRCLVLHIKAPTEDQLVTRGVAHFGDGKREDVLEPVAKMLIADREDAVPPRPGLAEYLDLVRAVLNLEKTQNRTAKDLINELREFTLRKQSGGTK